MRHVFSLIAFRYSRNSKAAKQGASETLILSGKANTCAGWQSFIAGMGQPYMAVVTTSTKVARGIAWAGLYQVFEAAVSFAAMLVLVRLISPIDYGRASAVAGFLGLMNAVSINSLVPHALQIPESQEPDWSLHWSVGCYVQGALFCCCEIIAFLCFLTRGYRPIASLLSVAGFGLLFDLANSLSINMIRRSLDYGRYRFLLGASVAFKIALIIILAVAGQGALGIVLGSNVVSGMPF